MNEKYLYYIPHVPKLVQLDSGDVFTVQVRNDVPIVKIPEKYLNQFLNMKAGCCDREFRAFREATQEEINLWLKN